MISEKAAGASTLPDKVLAQDLIKDCKFCVLTFAQAATEATDPQVRQFMSQSLREVTREQQRLADLMTDKGWYKPYDMERQLSDDIMMSRVLETNVGNHLK